jgi:hypothetical protein
MCSIPRPNPAAKILPWLLSASPGKHPARRAPLYRDIEENPQKRNFFYNEIGAQARGGGYFLGECLELGPNGP